MHVNAPVAGGRKFRPRLPAVVRESAFVLPAVVLTAGVILVPGIYALYRSFFAWDPGYASPWVGLGNYTHLFGLDTFRTVLSNELFLLLGLPLWILLPFMLAVLLHDDVRFAGLFRSVLLFPAILSPAVVAILFRAILAPDGLLNKTLEAVGLGVLTHRWIDSASLVKPTLIFVLAWGSVGIGVVIFSAALSSVPDELLQAARVDGAGWMRRLMHIVLPSVAPVLVFWAMYEVIAVFLYSFGWIYVLTGGGPGYSSTTMDYDVYQRAFVAGDFGSAAAESVVLLLLVVITATVSYGVVHLLRRRWNA